MNNSETSGTKKERKKDERNETIVMVMNGWMAHLSL